jgi:hypothetical protein
MALPVVMAAIAGGAALAKGISGAVQASKARKALENFQRQELKNITEGMRVSTLGAELQTQEAQRRFATSVDALRSGGVRGVVGGLGQQEQLQQSQQQQIAASLDEQQRQIEMMRAQDEARIRGMQEERETFDIGRLAGQQAAGRAQMSSAIGDIAGIATSFISPAGKATPKNNTTLMSQTGLKPVGVTGSAKFGREGFLGLTTDKIKGKQSFLGFTQADKTFQGYQGIDAKALLTPVEIPRVEYNIKPVQ